jgi:hypothetical protein
VLSGEATHTNFIVFDLTRSGLEPTIYRTRGEHANHHKADLIIIISLKMNLFSPWYCWKYCWIGVKNNHSLTHSLTHTYITVLLWRHEPVVYAKHHTVILQSKLFFLDNKEAIETSTTGNLHINKLLLNYISVRDYYLMCSYMNNTHCYESKFRLLPGYRDF